LTQAVADRCADEAAVIKALDSSSDALQEKARKTVRSLRDALSPKEVNIIRKRRTAPVASDA
jgi:hypothetical protein